MEKTLSTKLLEAQKEIGAIKRTKENPYYQSKYADINAILAEVKPILNRHGLVLLQGLSSLEGKFGLSTAIVDADTGQEIRETCPLPEIADPQKQGSAITYFRRYAIQSLLALEAEDDDANATILRDEDEPDFEEPEIKPKFKI